MAYFLFISSTSRVGLDSVLKKADDVKGSFWDLHLVQSVIFHLFKGGTQTKIQHAVFSEPRTVNRK